MKQKIRDLIGDYEPLLEDAHRRKLHCFGHTTRMPGLLALDLIRGLVEGSRG